MTVDRVVREVNPSALKIVAKWNTIAGDCRQSVYVFYLR